MKVKSKSRLLWMLAASLAMGGTAMASGTRVSLAGGSVDTAVACSVRRAMDQNVRPVKVVQFHQAPTAADRAAIEATGAVVLGPLPTNALLVRSAGSAATLRGSSSTVRYVGDYLPRFALARDLGYALGSEEPAPVLVLLAETDSLNADIEWILEHAVEQSVSDLSVPSANRVMLTCHLPGNLLETLAQLPSVLRVENAAKEILPTGERSSLVTAGQTYFVGGVEKAIPAGVSVSGKTNDYLYFLGTRLDGLSARPSADYMDSREYPVVTLMDDGLDPFSAYASSTPTPGQRLEADNPDLYTFGDITGESRIDSAFHYNYGTATIPVIISGVPQPPDPLLDFGYPEINETFIRMSPISHTAATTSVLAGYNDGTSNADRDGNDPTQFNTQHRYGIGVSPYGRIAGANFDLAPSVLGQFYPPPPNPQPDPVPFFFQPDDFSLISGEIVRRSKATDGFTGGAALVNQSLLIFPIGAGFDCSDLDTQPVRPPIGGKTYHSYRTTSDRAYDLYSQRFDQLTRSTYYWEDEETLNSGETLFIAAAGNFGFYIPGQTPSQHCPIPNPFGAAIPATPGESAPAMGVISAPALAKNVLTVGGSEVANPYGDQEYCASVLGDLDVIYAKYTGYLVNTNSQDIMRNSSKGWESLGRPNDVRIKPEIVAPASGIVYNSVRDPRDFGQGVRPAGCEVITNAIRSFSTDLADFTETFTPCLDCILPPFRGNIWMIPSITMFYDIIVDGNPVRIWQDDDFRSYIATVNSGTSASAPHVAGALQLAGYFLRNQYGIENPSAALYKAYAIHTARMLDGAHTGPYRVVNPAGPEFDFNDRLLLRIPNSYQGFGRIDMGMGLDSTARYIVNQQFVLKEDGPRSFTIAGRVQDPNKPVRVALVWTDPAAEAGADAWQGAIVNDLDLIVSTYTPKGPIWNRLKFFVGNLFQDPEPAIGGGHICHSKDLPLISFSGGQLNFGFANDVDFANNSEAVFLAPKAYNDESSIDTKTKVAITVLGRHLRGNALQAYDTQSGTMQQDFALVAYNFIPETPAILLGNGAILAAN